MQSRSFHIIQLSKSTSLDRPALCQLALEEVAMADQTLTLVKELTSLIEKLSPGGGGNQSARNEALILSRKITASLEQPQKVAVDLVFSMCPVFLLCPISHWRLLYWHLQHILTTHSRSWLWLREWPTAWFSSSISHAAVGRSPLGVWRQIITEEYS